jgi:hypothetical protein
VGLLDAIAKRVADRLAESLGPEAAEPPMVEEGFCPNGCGASTSRQVESSPFGPKSSRRTLCGCCGYEYPRERT